MLLSFSLWLTSLPQHTSRLRHSALTPSHCREADSPGANVTQLRHAVASGEQSPLPAEASSGGYVATSGHSTWRLSVTAGSSMLTSSACTRGSIWPQLTSSSLLTSSAGSHSAEIQRSLDFSTSSCLCHQREAPGLAIPRSCLRHELGHAANSGYRRPHCIEAPLRGHATTSDTS